MSRAQTRAIEQVEASPEPVAVAAITLWEIAMLAERGRIRFDQAIDAVIENIEQHSGIVVLPIDGRVALESTRLGPNAPGDPADRLIIASARVHGLRLVTADERIRDSHVVSVV